MHTVYVEQRESSYWVADTRVSLDSIVSLKGASQEGLAKIFSLAPTTLGHPKNYQLLLGELYESLWFNEPEPESSHERDIWLMRAALVDCFVYKRTGR